MIFGLGAALGWGLADFFGAVAGRRIGAIGTVLAGQLLSALCVSAVLLSSGESLRPLGSSIWLVEDVDRIDAKLWLPITDVVVISDYSGRCLYPTAYIIVNIDESESVCASRIRE